MMTKTFVGLKVAPALIAASLLLSACGNTWGQRAVTGGGIGAAGGAALGAMTGGLSILGGALIGGAVGAGVGAATTPR
jgi:osmotically inducible lipoprotein OsmB